MFGQALGITLTPCSRQYAMAFSETLPGPRPRCSQIRGTPTLTQSTTTLSATSGYHSDRSEAGTILHLWRVRVDGEDLVSGVAQPTVDQIRWLLVVPRDACNGDARLRQELLGRLCERAHAPSPAFETAVAAARDCAMNRSSPRLERHGLDPKGIIASNIAPFGGAGIGACP